jgi:hypothetical protein
MWRRGNPEKHRRIVRRQGSGVTRREAGGRRRRTWNTRRLGIQSIGVARGVRIRGNPENRHWQTGGSQNPGQLGRLPAGAGRSRKRGNLRNGSSAIPKGPAGGATRRLANRHRRSMRDSGQPGDPSPAEAGRCRPRGNLRTHRRRCGRREEAGRPGESLKPATLKDAKFGATRRSIAGTAKGRGSGATRGRVAGAAGNVQYGVTRKRREG